MKQHPLLKSETFWLCLSLFLSAMILILVFGGKIFEGSFQISSNSGTLTFPISPLYVLLPLFIVCIVFCIKQQFPASSTSYGNLMIRFTGLTYLGLAGFYNLLMSVFGFATATTTGQREPLLPNGMIITVISVLSLSMAIVLALLLFTVFKKKRSLA